MRRAPALLALAVLLTSPAAAQNSVYGLIGIGFPGHPLSVRARSTGGATGALDPASPLNPANAVSLGWLPGVGQRLAAGGAAGTSLRRYTAGDSTITGLRETRFPLGIFGGRLPGTGFSFAVSFSTYAERTYDVTTTGTQVLRGDTIEVTDRVASDGAVTDFRGAIAFRLGDHVAVGGAFHLLGGSSRLTVSRTFSDSSYAAYVEQNQLTFRGTGASVGVSLTPTNAIALAASARVDGDLKTRNRELSAGTVRLPVSLVGGLHLRPATGISLSSTVVRQSWSRAQPDLFAPSRAFDTWEVGSGIELAPLGGRGPAIPIRLGYRYRQLPFSNVATQPTETAFTGGTGASLGGGRALLDAAVERFRRSGGGAEEEGWYFTLGVTIIP